MATLSQPIVEPRKPNSAVWEFLKQELAPTPNRLNATLRDVVCVVSIILVGEAARSQFLYLALFAVILTERDDPREALKAGLGITAFAFLSGLITLLLLPLAGDQTWFRVLLIFASVFFGMLIGRKFSPLAGLLISALASEALRTYDSSSNSEDVVDAILWFSLMYCFGTLTVPAIGYLFPHATPLERLEAGIDQRLQAAGAVFKNISGAPLSDGERKHRDGVNGLATTGISPLNQALAAVSSGQMLSDHDLLRWQMLLPNLELLTGLAAKLGHYRSSEFDEDQRAFAAALSDRVTQLAEDLKEAGRSGANGRIEGLAADWPRTQVQALLLFQAGEIVNSLFDNWRLEAEFQTLAIKDSAPVKKAPSPPFFARDSVHFAFKVAIASMICYVLYNAVDWPGISTCLITCPIVALDTVGATYRKLMLRLTGAVVGGLIFGIGGIALVLSNMSNVFELCLYAAVVYFVAGWVAKGSGRISYAGLQIALAFGLVAMREPVIPSEISAARDRVIGVLLASVVMWFVFGHLWPVNTLAQQRSKLAALIRNAADLLRLVTDDRPKDEKVARLQELRQSAKQALFAVSGAAEVSGFDSPHDARLQQTLSNLQQNAHALFMLEVIEVSLSLQHDLSSSETDATDDKNSMHGNANLLDKIASEVEEANDEQFQSAVRQLGDIEASLNELIMQASNDNQARIAQRRHSHVSRLVGSVKKLS